MFNKKGVELSTSLLIKIIIGLLVLVVLLLILMAIGGKSFGAIGQQLSNAIESLTGLEFFE